MDETPQIINDLLDDRKKFVKLLRIKKNIGYGHGIMEGVRYASGDIISWTHADLQTDLIDILEAQKIFINHEDYPDCILKGKKSGS